MYYEKESGELWRKQAAARERNRLLGFLRRGKTVFCIEGEWSGYRISQQRIVHREYTAKPDRAEAVKKLGAIHYTDGTSLWLRVYPVKSKESIQPTIDGYSSLINTAVKTGITDVAKMP